VWFNGLLVQIIFFFRIAPNIRITGELWVEKDLEGRSIVGAVFQNLHTGTLKNFKSFN
jgi:hypothetical protein